GVLDGSEGDSEWVGVVLDLSGEGIGDLELDAGRRHAGGEEPVAFFEAASVERLDDQLDVASAEEPEVAGLGGQGSRMGGSGLTGGRLPRGLDLKASVQAEDGVRAETPERGILPCDGGQRGGEALGRLLGVAQRCASGRTAGEDRSIGDGLEGLT